MSQLPDYSPPSVLIGCYTKGAGGEGDGISLVHRDVRTGALGPTEAVVTAPAPSFVVVHPSLPVLYAVNEVPEGAVSAFAIMPDGDLSALGSWPTAGSFPCHLGVDSAARHLVVANYGSGSVASFELDGAGIPFRSSGLGQHSGVGKDPQRQEGPHAHQVIPTGDGVVAVDLGVDTVFRYRRDPTTGDLGEPEVALRLRPGTGPRRLVVDRFGLMHVVGELDASVTSFARRGPDWHELGSTASSAAPDSLPSEMALSPDGRHLYVANRGPDTIAVFALSGGPPAFVGEVSTGGAWPRHFAFVVSAYVASAFVAGAFAADSLYVPNERSHTVVAFRIDPSTGMPTPTGDVLATPSPTCIAPHPPPPGRRRGELGVGERGSAGAGEWRS